MILPWKRINKPKGLHFNHLELEVQLQVSVAMTFSS